MRVKAGMSVNITEHRYRTIVVGSGAAGYASAIRLAENGIETVLVTENVNAGTSRNTGSDKQTYYKLSLASGDSDSVLQMAQDLFPAEPWMGIQPFARRLCRPGVFSTCWKWGSHFPRQLTGNTWGIRRIMTAAGVRPVPDRIPQN